MRFRPCIDIHNGKVKQIIGGSLRDQGDKASENFVSGQDADYYANLYQKDGLKGGHVILLNPVTSPYYEATRKQALRALAAYPGGLQLGGGVTAENAATFLDAGASHVIVTSYVFRDGRIQYENLERLVGEIGKEHLVLDLSCRKKEGEYDIVTDRWQKFTDVPLNRQTLDELAGYCDEFLVHAADVEGKSAGIELPVAELLGNWGKRPVTYAGGVGSYEDLSLLREAGKNQVDVTVGSALDLFGGSLSYRKILEICNKLL
ncbi:MAG: phosphoribosylformimino-5-aminoimidazole carboxamide ribotide isomerase [Lachnospiraceae bacterium]|nr:phosphoribosylformimino-5-aminoimidazole carboxamide ribotide isomerase [Lachnospiraceae bacterium]